MVDFCAGAVGVAVTSAVDPMVLTMTEQRFGMLHDIKRSHKEELAESQWMIGAVFCEHYMLTVKWVKAMQPTAFAPDFSSFASPIWSP
jgi:hypothetical protein